MSLLTWAQWIVVLLIWGVGLNAIGAAWLRRRQQRAIRHLGQSRENA
ncbi:hypothetical protein H4W81_004923 [Nonomuraea africana]|uniref:Uncharacterized protein n=1 Tax=Nonomuraea africana TaxID=46171 RepID=A0ABR9KJE7_9ACTN|nr:hypothetical protein [Nonomuraea africana]